MASVEIIIIGSEVLLGMIDDTNSGYLCRAIRARGGGVRHVATVPDETETIAREVEASLRRATDLIFTCGGVGPTENDLTIEGVARGAGRRLVESEAARRFVERRYHELASQGHVQTAAMNQARLKMALVAEGAICVDNPVGAAPATVLAIEGSRIVSLPGVPAELRAIVEGPLQELLDEVVGRGCYRERGLAADCNDESALAPLLAEVSRAHPGVYIKPRPRGFGTEMRFRIRVSASARSSEEADSLIERACADLVGLLRDAGINAAADDA